MKNKEGRQIFIDNFIRLGLCSPYRAGFDPSKRWLSGEETVRAYVDPIPFKIQGGLFGRRTRCHKVWLTKGGVGDGDSKGNKDNDVFVLKESWTELDDDPKKAINMNTDTLPDEVRIFQEIMRRRGEAKSQSIEYGLLTLEAGDYVRIVDDGSSDSGKFSTIARYCGDLDI
ncbi:hypothetical protein IWQ62_006581, partial [Dispira parvispora]